MTVGRTRCSSTSWIAAASPARMASISRMWVTSFCSMVNFVIGLASPEVGSPSGGATYSLQQEADEEDRSGIRQDAEDPQHGVGEPVSQPAGRQPERDAETTANRKAESGQADVSRRRCRG